MTENSMEKSLHLNSKINFSPDNDSGSSSLPKDEDRVAEAAKALEASKYADLLSNVEVLGIKTEKPLLLHAADELIGKYEDSNFHNGEEKNDYAFSHILEVMSERQRNLELSASDLISLGIVEMSGREHNIPIFKVRGYSFKKELKEITTLSEIIKRPSKELDEVYKISQIEEDIIGTDVQRQALSLVVEELRGEMVARQDLTKMYGVIARNTENLEGIVQELYYKLSMTPKSLDIFFNAEARTNTLIKTAGGVRYDSGKERGQAIDAAVRCLEVVGCSEDYKKFKDLLQRPGIKYLFNVTDEEIDLLFTPQDQRRGRSINSVLLEWVGDPASWVDARGSSRKEGEYKSEVRGKLTLNGNIFVEKDQKQIDLIIKNIENFVSASEIPDNLGINKSVLLKREAKGVVSNAWRWFRITGKATTYGFTFYEKNGKILPFSDMGGVTSCDRIKVMYPEIFRTIYKQNKTEIRDWGPDGSFGKYERFGVDYDKGLTFEVEGIGKRTVDEIRWGYRALGNLPAEPAKRYGDIGYKDLNIKVFNKFALGMYIAGRPEQGIFQYIMKTDWKDIVEFINKDFWTKFAKHLGISLSSEVVVDGKFRGLTKEEIEKKKIDYKKRVFFAFWDGLRSLPQWRTWLNSEQHEVVNKLGTFSSSKKVSVFDRVKYEIKQTNILTPDEVNKLSTDYIGDPGSNA